MMKVKTSDLTGAALDWAVAKCEGFDLLNIYGHIQIAFCPRYSTDWAQGGPIIERETIATHKKTGTNYWVAVSTTKIETGSTPLIASMRCYVASKLGDEVEIPQELAQ